MPKLSLLQKFVWFSNPLILFACAFLLWKKGRARKFPGFLLYLLFVGVKTYAMLPVAYFWGLSSYVYFYSWWTSDLVSIGISFYVLYEVVKNLLTSGTLTLSRTNVALTVGVLSIAASLLSFSFQAPSHDLLTKIPFLLNSVARFQQTILLVLLALLTLFFGFYWENLAFGIAAGFGFYASMELMDTYLRGYMGPGLTHLFNVVDVLAYQMASLTWLFYILKKPKLPIQSLPSDKVSEYSEPIARLIK